MLVNEKNRKLVDKVGLVRKPSSAYHNEKLGIEKIM
jgi:hypothetical protein